MKCASKEECNWGLQPRTSQRYTVSCLYHMTLHDQKLESVVVEHAFIEMQHTSSVLLSCVRTYFPIATGQGPTSSFFLSTNWQACMLPGLPQIRHWGQRRRSLQIWSLKTSDPSAASAAQGSTLRTACDRSAEPMHSPFRVLGSANHFNLSGLLLQYWWRMASLHVNVIDFQGEDLSNIARRLLRSRSRKGCQLLYIV